MEPLHWPNFYRLNPNEPRHWWERLPFIGYLLSFNDFGPVVREVEKQLLARLKPDLSVWGDEPKHLEMARYLCALLKEEYNWPNDHFIPEDPFEIVFQIPWDDLQIVEIVMRIEEELEIEIKDEEVEKWSGELKTVVAFLVAKQG